MLLLDRRLGLESFLWEGRGGGLVGERGWGWGCGCGFSGCVGSDEFMYILYLI